MLLTIATTHEPATDLGYLLHKHPDKVQQFPLAHGVAHVFYPQATAARCEAALLVELDPVDLVRGRRTGRSRGDSVFNYVNDRPYAASSFASVAINKVLRSALAGRCPERQALADRAIALEARIAAVRCRAGAAMIERVFEPLGYAVEATPVPLDAAHPEWGDSAYFVLELSATTRLADLLGHLYVLLPVLDNDKHYWVGDDEVEKLVAKGAGWLADHPEKPLIVRRYLGRRRRLHHAAFEQLVSDQGDDPDAADETRDEREQAAERPISLNDQRLGTVVAAIKQSGASTVGDLGCGEGRLLGRLMDERGLERIVGVDASTRALEIAHDRLRLDRYPERARPRVELIQGALSYRDARLADLDALCLVEVIEHLDPGRLADLERAVFACAQPATVIVTTPNREYNVLFESLPEGALRHGDHRFEWTREEFGAWVDAVAARHGYRSRLVPIGSVDAALGPPTQMCVFER